MEYIKGGDEGSLDTLVRTEKALFIFYADPYINFSRPKHLFYAAAQRADLEVVVDRVFTERDGTPVIEVVRLKGKTRTHSQCISCFDKSQHERLPHGISRTYPVTLRLSKGDHMSQNFRESVL